MVAVSQSGGAKMQWYYLVQGQRQGPVDDAALEGLVRDGTVADSTYVWREGFSEWQVYSAVKPTAPDPRPPLRPEGPPFGAQPSPLHMSSQPLRPLGGQPAAAAAPARAYSPPVAKAAPASKNVFFFYPVLIALSDGSAIRKAVVVALKVAAIVAALAGLLMAVSILTVSSHGTGTALLGGILFAILLLGAGICVAQIFWYRSGSVAALGSSRYSIISIFSILSRASGEAAATSLLATAAGACLFLWLAGTANLPITPGLPIPIQVDNNFVAGLIVLIYLAALAFAALILGYLWAETIMLLVDIEQNTRHNPKSGVQ